jgi:ADP-ribose diphosphatase
VSIFIRCLKEAINMSDHWEVLETHNLLDCSPWFTVRQESVRLEDGQTIVPNFYIIDALSYAMVFALTPDQQVVLVEQYKHAAGRRVFELPAGYVTPGEAPLECAQRELLEETGMAAPEWKPLGTFIQDGNRGCGTCFAFLARGAKQVATPDSGDLQRQVVHLFDLPTLRDFWLSGGLSVVGSVAIIGLGLAALQEHG